MDNLEMLTRAYEKAFNVKIDKLEFKKLENGDTIIMFYDPRLGRKRIVDQNTRTELRVYDIDYFKANYNELVQGLPADKAIRINSLLEQSNLRECKYINIDKMIALDSKGNVVEASLNNKNEVRVGLNNNGYSTSLDENIEPDVKIGEQTEVEQTVTTPDPDQNTPQIEDDIDTKIVIDEEVKTMIEEEMEKHQIQGSPEEEYNKVVLYSNDRAKLDKLHDEGLIDDNYYDFYIVCSEAYVKKITYKKDNSLSYTMQSGFITVFIMAFIAIMFSIVALLLINL